MKEEKSFSENGNALDAYIFAHMRSFDVSDDLSASVGPAILQDGHPGVRVRVNLY